MLVTQHDKVIKYLEEVVTREYSKLIDKNKAFVRTKWVYKIPLTYPNYLYGECDFIYMDLEARSSYIIEVKRDNSKKNEQKALHQIIRDFWATNEFYSWAYQNGYMAWYYPEFGGKKLIVDSNYKTVSKYLKDYIKERIKEYEEFFKEILKAR